MTLSRTQTNAEILAEMKNPCGPECRAELNSLCAQYLETMQKIPALDIDEIFRNTVLCPLQNHSGSVFDYTKTHAAAQAVFECELKEARILRGARILNAEDIIYPKVLDFCQRHPITITGKTVEQLAQGQMLVMRAFYEVNTHKCIEAYYEHVCIANRVKYIRDKEEG